MSLAKASRRALAFWRRIRASQSKASMSHGAHEQAGQDETPAWELPLSTTVSAFRSSRSASDPHGGRRQLVGPVDVHGNILPRGRSTSTPRLAGLKKVHPFNIEADSSDSMPEVHGGIMPVFHTTGNKCFKDCTMGSTSKWPSGLTYFSRHEFACQAPWRRHDSTDVVHQRRQCSLVIDIEGDSSNSMSEICDGITSVLHTMDKCFKDC